MTDKRWLTEPNELRWTDEDTGLECLIKRNPELLHLCGYAKVDPTNYLCNGMLGKQVGESLDVHGGVTFQGLFNADGEDGCYYIGFDCAHYTDYVPGTAAFQVQSGIRAERWGIYRDIEYVKAECKKLAAQVYEHRQKAIMPPSNQATVVESHQDTEVVTLRLTAETVGMLRIAAGAVGMTLDEMIESMLQAGMSNQATMPPSNQDMRNDAAGGGSL